MKNRKILLNQISLPKRCLSFVIPPKNLKAEKPTLNDGEPVLFQANQAFPIRLMLGSGLINFGYWSYNLYTISAVTMGLNITEHWNNLTLLATSPLWTYLGLTGTGLIFFFTKMFANRVICLTYENPETKRLGFQTYTLFGTPGRKIEVKPVNVTFGKESLKTSLLPIKIIGLDYRLLLDRDGYYYDNGRLRDILHTSAEIQRSGGVVISKEERQLKLKEIYQKSKISSKKQSQNS